MIAGKKSDQGIGLRSDGTVVAVGWNSAHQLNVTGWSNIQQIAVGQYHTVGLKTDGTVVAVGYNTYGQIHVATWNLIVPKSVSKPCP